MIVGYSSPVFSSEFIDGAWGGAVAADAYRGPSKAALKKEFPFVFPDTTSEFAASW